MNLHNLTSKEHWNASLYDNQHGFVWNYGTELIEILAPQAGERILDLGCGTGHLTHEIALSGAIVLGLDKSPTMIAQAVQNYPSLQFMVADAADFLGETPFDAVFSNAALHWMKDPKAVIHCIWQNLQLGGRFVAELGGKGNVQQIVTAIQTVLAEAGYSVNSESNPWYFPSIGEYTSLLEQQGFEVTYATLFERPTRLEMGEQGMMNWLKMFGHPFFSDVPENRCTELMQQVVADLRPTLYRENAWFADYKRLRVVALKRKVI